MRKESENTPIGPISWRVCAVENLEVLAALERECFPPPRGRAWSRIVLQQLLDDPKYRVWLGFLAERVVAYAIFWSVGEEGEIDRIGVASHHRRRGLGLWTMQEVLGELKKDGVARAFLEVREDNLAARRLYENLGFNVVGRRPNYYDDGCAAWVLCRELMA